MTITKTEKEWIAQKERELAQQTEDFGGQVVFWDNYRYMDILRKLQRENRRLKVQVGAKK